MGVQTTTTSYCCLQIQQMLDAIANGNAPQNKVLESYGYLKALRSDANMSGSEIVATKSAEGKARPTASSNRKVEIAYPVRQCDAVSLTPTAFCTTRTAEPDDFLYSSATVDLYVESTWSLTKTQFRDICEDRETKERRTFMNKLNDCMRSINSQLIDAYIAGLGNYFTEIGGTPVDSGGIGVKTLNLFQPNGTNGLTTNGLAFMPLMRDYNRSDWSGRPIVVGGTSLQAWFNATPAFAGNVEGADGTRVAGNMVVSFDYQIDIQFADALEHLIVFPPGVTQMMEWDAYPAGTDYEVLDNPEYSKTTIFVDGMSMDLAINFDRCTDRYDFQLSKYFDMFKIPTDAFNTACGQFSNGCIQYLVDCAALDCNYVKL